MRFIIYILFCFVGTQLWAQNIDTHHLLLDLTFDWQKKVAQGSAEIRFSTLKTCDTITLDAGFLTIESVKSSGYPLRFLYDNSDTPKNLFILLDRKYAPNEEITIKIQYQTRYQNQSDPYALGGSFGKGLRFITPTSAAPSKQKQIWSSGEPENNKYWFPCNEDLSDIHTTEILATVEKKLMVISNGTLVKTIDNQNNTHTFHYLSESAFPNYLVSIVVGEYINISQHSGKTSLFHFGYPSEKQAVEATTVLLPDMLRYLEEKTACKYPFSTYRQVVVQDYPFPGLVGQNTTCTLSDNYIDDEGVHNDYKYLWDGVALQALANQWFGNMIMPKQWNDIWLNNAFAQYFAGLYTSQRYGKEEYLLWYYPFEKSNIMGDWEAGNIHPMVPNKVENVRAFTNDSYSKYKGALVLRMLQYEMGEENWWKAVQYFVNKYAHKQVCTQDFQNAVEAVSGKSYQWFFNQWFYKIGLPKFKILKHFDAPTQQLKVVVEQIQDQKNTSIYPQCSYFEGKIKVEIDGQMEHVYIQAQPTNTFTFHLQSPPQFFNFNAEQIFLCEVEEEKSKEEYLQLLANSTDAFAKQDALMHLVTIANAETTDILLKNKITLALIEEVDSHQYWRYRWAALTALSKTVSLPYDTKIIDLLTKTIHTERGWLKMAAINLLGNTRDSVYLNIYTEALHDKSDRVIAAAATAIGKTQSSKAFEILMQLENQPSWKNQNRISLLNGLQQLHDMRAVDYVLACLKDNYSPRWYLATPAWDYPFTAVQTLVSLGKADMGYPILLERLQSALKEEDVNDIFQNVQLINMLKSNQALDIYPLLRTKFKDTPAMMPFILYYENQLQESIQK